MPCPSCNKPYLILEQSPVEGRLPLHLKCGHTICEQCLVGVLKCSEPQNCQVCNITISVEQLSQTIRDRFAIRCFFAAANFAPYINHRNANSVPSAGSSRPVNIGPPSRPVLSNQPRSSGTGAQSRPTIRQRPLSTRITRNSRPLSTRITRNSRPLSTGTSSRQVQTINSGTSSTGSQSRPVLLTANERSILKSSYCITNTCVGCSGPSSVMCKDCKIIVCDKCFKRRHRNSHLRSHILQSIGEVICQNFYK